MDTGRQPSTSASCTFSTSSLEVYGVIMGGWSLNSKYPFLLRSAAQMVSYEVSIGFAIVTVLLTVGSLNLTDIVCAAEWHRYGRRPAIVLPGLELACTVPDVHHLLHLGTGRNQPSALFDLPKLNPNSSPASWSSMVPPLHDVHAQRIRGHRPDVLADDDPVLGGRLPPVDVCSSTVPPASSGSC